VSQKEGIKNVVSFLDPINKNFKEWTKKGRLRLAFSLMLGGVLQPLVTITQIPGLNYNEWENALKNLLAAATLAAKKKDKKSWVRGLCTASVPTSLIYSSLNDSKCCLSRSL